ncbi:N-acetylglucosamine kinase [Streptomyces sp. NPDC050560]|uniref:N-acetylglucosamine kinase n=1 Tax=Streptomyces sp. NPDC050560 TaxID=3365630 RepID=UPI003799D937
MAEVPGPDGAVLDGLPADTGVLGVDSGGSGLRAVLMAPEGPALALASRTPVRTGPEGIDAGQMLDLLLPMARRLMARAGTGRLASAVVGAAGMVTLGDGLRARLPGALRAEFGVRRIALAADAVIAYAGALGERPGGVVAGGTGLIALGTDLTGWRRADGWGHLLGDRGGGAWIGRAGLDAALCAHDGMAGGSAELLAAAEEMFGPARSLPGQVYPRTDRPAVLASFAPRVAAARDEVAAGIMRSAAWEIARTAAAVCPPDGELALTGGLFKLGEPLLGPLRDEFAKRLPGARQVPAAGGPADGAVHLAAALAHGRLALPVDGTMLWVTPDTETARA